MLRMRLPAGALLAVALSACAGSQDRPPAPEWQRAAEKKGFTPKDIELLGRNKILMTGETYRQVFGPYIETDLPVFITSDSLLRAFHVLYEESIVRMEKVNARRLAAILPLIWKNLETAGEKLDPNRDLVAAARRRARIIIGTTLKLAGDESIKFDADLAGREEMERYFRVASWLQSIPFRVEKDEELLSILMLADCATSERFPSFAERDEATYPFQSFRRFFGLKDDWDLLRAERLLVLVKDLGGVAAMRKRLLEAHANSCAQINDQLRFPPDEPGTAAEPQFRILSAWRTPDAVLFHRTMQSPNARRDLPGGLEVAAALGSGWARSMLTGTEGLVKTIDESKPLFEGSGFHMEYLRCLASLLDRAEPEAPKFMSSEDWKAKSCQTALGGWALLRHTWVLQAKSDSTFFCGLDDHAGFVEPVPDFFARLADLVGRIRENLQGVGVLDPDPREYAAPVRRLVELAEKDPDPMKLPDSDCFRCSRLLLETICKRGEELRRRAAALKDDVARMEAGKMPDDPELAQGVRYADKDLAGRWERLEKLCLQLELLAHKQLRGAPFSGNDEVFVRAYGQRLANLMFYESNSYAYPADNAPCVADVYQNPNVGRYLEIAVGRPRALYVLYPTREGEVLCRGAVTTYFEFPSGQRLTDVDWRKLLGQPDAPAQPEWIKPLSSDTKTDPKRLTGQ